MPDSHGCRIQRTAHGYQTRRRVLFRLLARQAVVLYYYRVSDGIVGGNLEFCSKATEVFEAEGGSYDADLVRQWLQNGIRRCQVPIREGTLLVFSNYAAVHRVLRMVAQHGAGSRDFVAFFVVDQRKPLPSPPLADREVRLQQRQELMAEQLKPTGRFGLDHADVYGTGNAGLADIGWVRNPNVNMPPKNFGDEFHKTVGLLEDMNLVPPPLRRGMSYALTLPERALYYNPRSAWEEHTLRNNSGQLTRRYVEWGFGRVSQEVPGEGVSTSIAFTSRKAWLAHTQRYDLEDGSNTERGTDQS